LTVKKAEQIRLFVLLKTKNNHLFCGKNKKAEEVYMDKISIFVKKL